MENSIEQIWKEGFINDEALVAPKLNDLYNQKSIDLIDKFKRSFKINIIAIFAFGVLLAAVFIVFGQEIIGTLLFTLLFFIVVQAKRQYDTFDDINKGTSSYDYLKSFDRWHSDLVTYYEKFYTYFYPIFFLVFSLNMWYAVFDGEVMDKFLVEFPDLSMIYGFPVVVLIGLLLGAAILGIFAKKLYRLDRNLVYGKMFAKLDEMIADMEELRS